ncbi:GCN5-related N-acetyltransferase [Thermotoga petrophila RKU-10]|uniref:GCN5-related N-acetyltransferase n=2 Tax=Thermotoga petrophila TaxID=93929 RepID=A5IJJ7_THEP1|nr:GNAT family N-acetyltransferase [Thermotoga petrophila]ABQ46370.1 GCN5-related N-acetyltransferase [Thermotoga petrophila RKU-1]ADA66461.1 GCN5-related N-acetyltransferase [Thermotoga petrophila RKU-10]
MFPRKEFLKNGSLLLIREASIWDAKRIVEYMKEVTSETDFLITRPDEVYDVSTERNYIRMYRNNPGKLMIVGEINREIVSLLTFTGFGRKRTKHVGEIGISVKKRYWNIGIGTRMITSAIEWARRNDFIRIQLEVLKSNERAISLYRKLGFELEGVKRKAVRRDDGSFEDVFVMALLLD